MKRTVFYPAVLLLLLVVFTFQNTESSEESISLKFIQVAGESPKVFTEGWVFGAGCIIPPGIGNAKDLNSQIHWTGTGKFYPEYGPETHPVFDKAGENKITAAININGKIYSKTFTVVAVIPDLYACVGDRVFCPACSHGNPCCPHPVSGAITGGSPTVMVRGKPAARLGDGGMHSACCGDNMFTISEGDENVLIDGKPAAIIGSATKHCGGIGHIVVDELVHTKEILMEKVIKKNKETNTEGVYFPLEFVPQSKIDRMTDMKKKASADRYMKMDGPDYATSAMDMISEISDIFGLESSTLAFVSEVGELECLEKINSTCGKIGILFSVIEIVNNVYEGKKTDAFYNTLKAAGYFAIDCGWSSLKIASFAIVILDYTLKRFMKEMIDSHYDAYKRGFYEYFNNDPDAKRDFKMWKAKLTELYNKAGSNKEDYQPLINDELKSYYSKFWNPEVYIRYIPGFKGDLTPDEIKKLEDIYTAEILSPVFNAIFTGFVENERRIVDKEIKAEIQKLVQLYNTKFKFVVKVNGPANKINKVPVRIGEWQGLTDDKGLWVFDATLYAFLKNKTPNVAKFTVGLNDEREVEFKLKDKTEITFNMPKPVTLDLTVALSKETEGAGISAMASALNFDQYTIPADVSSQKIEWVWKVNGNVQSYTEGDCEMKSNQYSGTIDEAGTYVILVELINKTEGSNGFNNPIATATKTVTVKKDKAKEKEKEKEIVVVEKKEEKK